MINRISGVLGDSPPSPWTDENLLTEQRVDDTTCLL
jgi:hypothetical protein